MSAKIVGDASSTDYRVHLDGRGFVPSALDYNLSSGTGAATAEFTVEVFRADGLLNRVSSAVDVISTRALEAHLDQPLTPGLYGVRLVGMNGPLDTLEGAFDVPVMNGEDGGVLADAGLPDTAV